MTRQYLIPVKDIQDANKAIAHIPEVATQGDEVVVLVISDVPQAELVGSKPPPTVMDPLANSGGVSSAPRAADDVPQFIGREEFMEIKRRELLDALNPQIARLHELGYDARVETVFSDEPGETIRDAAGDLTVADIYITEEYRSDLDEQIQEVVKVL
jgi:hypothetical protein